MNHHCDNYKAFVCKKSPGDTGPITDPPTQTVPGYCPEGYMPVRKYLALCSSISEQFRKIYMQLGFNMGKIAIFILQSIQTNVTRL